MSWPKGKRHGRTPLHLFGKKTAAHRLAIGDALRGRIIQPYRKERMALNRARHRVRIGKAPCCEWSTGDKEFARFLRHIGPIPKQLLKPSLGRINHNLGYVEKNILWQEHSLNSTLRRGTKNASIAYPIR